MAFCTFGPIWLPKAPLARWGRSNPFHMHIGKIGQFFRIRVFPYTGVGLCIDGPHNTAEHLQNTPGTPAIHFPLVAAGSQSALYRRIYIDVPYVRLAPIFTVPVSASSLSQMRAVTLVEYFGQLGSMQTNVLSMSSNMVHCCGIVRM